MKASSILLLILLVCAHGAAQTRRVAPRTRIVGEAIVWRISADEGRTGSRPAPWKEVRVTNVFGFKRKPVMGDKVTVVPLDVEIAPLDLRITEIKERNDCGSHWWEVELEPVRQRAFFDIAPRPDRVQEFPFDVGIVYPAVKYARQIKGKALRKGMLPAGVSLNTVKGALDLTGDGVPDALIVDYCCRDPGKAAKGCDYTCGKIFRKIRNAWKIVNTSSPC